MSNKNVTTIDSAPARSTAPASAVADAPQKLGSVSGAGADFSGDRAIVQIAVSPEDGGKQAVFVGAQGVGFLIPRGKNWDVPVEVANALRDANVTSYQRTENDKDWERVESPRFSFIATDKPKLQPVEA